MECNYRGTSRAAILKRRQKRIRQCRILYPNDAFLDNLPANHVNNHVHNIPLSGHETLDEPEQMETEVYREIGHEHHSGDDVEKKDQQYLDIEEDFNEVRYDPDDAFERDADENKDEHHSGPPFFQSNNITCCPMIANPQWSSKDHLFHILALSVKFNLSYECTLDMLKYAKKSHKVNNLPTTKKQLWKTLWRDKNAVTYHLYCKQCGGYICEGRKPTKHCSCNMCGPDKSMENTNYFLQLNLRSQLSQLFSVSNVIEQLRYRFTRIKKNDDAIEDIYDGDEYRRLSSPGNFLSHQYNFSFIFNTDGCTISNSSNCSAWPVYLQINELPPHLRKKYMLLAAIFVEQKHPLVSTLLRPLVAQLQDLYENGINWKPMPTFNTTSKFIVIIGSVDSVARSMVTRIKQYNGEYSCLCCYAKGIRENNKFVFPIQESAPKLRTDDELLEHMKSATTKRIIVYGVKGVSPLAAFPQFSICKGMVIEAMHAVFLGVVKQHLNLLLTSFGTPYYIGSQNNKAAIDARLLSIKPPSRRSRLPRSIKTCGQWKASEFKNWLEYAPVCLDGILEKKYVHHIAQLAEAIHILNNDLITPQELKKSEHLLLNYTRRFQEYFGKINMSFNIHLITHLTDTVRNWGPIWVHSAFNFESWNRKIMDKVTSANGRAEQVTTRYMLSTFLDTAICDNTLCHDTKNFIKEVRKTVSNSNTDIKRFIFIGKAETRSPTEDEKRMLAANGYEINLMACFKAVRINNIEYRCKELQSSKRCNSIIYCGTTGFCEIMTIIKFIHDETTIKGMFVKKFLNVNFAFDTQYIQVVAATDDTTFIHMEENIKPAFTINTPQCIYAMKFANCWETD